VWFRIAAFFLGVVQVIVAIILARVARVLLKVKPIGLVELVGPARSMGNDFASLAADEVSPAHWLHLRTSGDVSSSELIALDFAALLDAKRERRARHGEVRALIGHSERLFRLCG
jgi:hypothetical protein